ncbi:MAG: flavodoxin domain-containing protein [Bacteroidales bacterium]|nr:flavodoxin domain-containing protein [Bacteroidales bacterium]
MGNKTTAIVYCTKYGTAQKISQAIREALCGSTEVSLFHLHDGADVDVANFDTVVLLTSIYAGKPRKEMTAFCSRHEGELLQKRLFVAICGMDKGNAIKEIETAYSPALIHHAADAVFFEGEYRLKQMHWPDRLLLRLFFKVKEPLLRDYSHDVKILTDKILAI